MQKFWMLKGPGGPPIQVIGRHDTAQLRALALSRKLQQPVVILEAVEVALPGDAGEPPPSHLEEVK